MSDVTGIQWTDATFNPWWGCTKVSPACDNCYAERDAKRYHPNEVLWGEGSTRRTFGEQHWKQPLKWNARAKEQGYGGRVFCASMADVFDKDGPQAERERLWRLIEQTPHLDWQLLTKRIGNVSRMVPPHWERYWPAQAWLGISVVTPLEVERDVTKLLKIIGPRVRFLSLEPLLQHVDLGPYLPSLQWVIVGGESGPGAREFHLQWARDVVAQCKAASVPVFVKQMGAKPVAGTIPIRYAHRKGGDMDEWPVDLRVQQFPRVDP